MGCVEQGMSVDSSLADVRTAGASPAVFGIDASGMDHPHVDRDDRAEHVRDGAGSRDKQRAQSTMPSAINVFG